jgi:hypothetical protein
MEEVIKSTEVFLTIEEQAESFTRQILNDILPTIDVPYPLLNIMGTLTILYNRILKKNAVKDWSLTGLLVIKKQDEFFNQSILELFL